MSHPRDHAFPGGFVLGKGTNFRVPSSYRQIDVPGEWSYWADELAEQELHVLGEDFLIVHGLSLYVGDSKQGLAETLLTAYLQDQKIFHEELSLVGGHYTVIIHVSGRTSVYQDPGGTRSVYYSTRVPLVASHATLLHEVSPHPTDNTVPAKPSRAWTRSPYEGVLALVPNFRLNVDSASIERFFPVGPNRFTKWTEGEKLARIEELWAKELEIMAGRDDKILFSITGGGDSRVLAALARDYLDQYLAFTYTGKNDDPVWSESMALDEGITRQILGEVPLNHRFLRREDSVSVSAELKEVISRNSFQPHGRWLIPLYRGLAPAGDAIHMRGTLLEIGRAYWIEQGETDSFDELFERAKKYSGKAGDEYREWLCRELESAGYSTPFPGYDRRDLLYWEMRIGRWFTECLNETDAAFETFLPLNVREMLEILLSFTLEERQNAHAYWELVNRSYPVLNFFGRNDRRNLYEQVRDSRAEQRTELSAIERDVVDALPSETFEVRDANGTVLKELPVEQHTIRIPEGAFESGNYASWTIATPEQPSHVMFTLHNAYSNPKGAGAFNIGVRVNDRVVLTEDGAAWQWPSTVTVANVPANSAVTVRIAVNRTNSALSWTRASRTAVTQVSMMASGSGNAVAAASSNPYAVTTTRDKSE